MRIDYTNVVMAILFIVNTFFNLKFRNLIFSSIKISSFSYSSLLQRGTRRTRGCQWVMTRIGQIDRYPGASETWALTLSPSWMIGRMRRDHSPWREHWWWDEEEAVARTGSLRRGRRIIWPSHSVCTAIGRTCTRNWIRWPNRTWVDFLIHDHFVRSRW